MRPDELKIVFDKYPPSAVGKYRLTVGEPYTALKINDDLKLYSLVDDAGVKFNVSTFGATYTNGGYWHIVGQTDCWAN
jgi:hypothetical protein